MNPLCPGFTAPPRTRREFLRRAHMAFGSLAFSALAPRWSQSAHVPAPHFKPKAKHVIFLFMDGGVSQVDSFDHKPLLAKHDGKTKKSFLGETKLSMGGGGANGKLLKSQWEFKQRGQSGLWVSDLFPHIAACADDLAVIHSMVGETPLHGNQAILTHTGRSIGAAPSFGAWISYGLGTESQNLPGYVLLNNDWVPNGGFQNFSNSFLPATHQATLIRANGTPVDNIVPSDSAALQRAKLDLLREQNASLAQSLGGSDAIESAIRNYETAALMQSAVPELCGVKGESAATLKLYGVDRAESYQRFYSLQCLRARRLIESGVRFIEITCPLTHINNAPWDQHGNLRKHHAENALITDQPVAALIHDLKARGLFDDTLILWAGEMGRTPSSASGDGRDHHVAGYSIWMAGGGIKGGVTHGSTDDFGYQVVENETSIHDVHATILHQLGLDHEQLTYRHGGRDIRLTDVHGKVLKKLIA